MTGGWARRVFDWLAASKLGLIAMALVVGAAAGLGAAAFRELIYLFTWLFTGRQTFGQQGHAASLHGPFLGMWFVLVVPVIAGVIYGPLIHRFAREARGHGVPEVMLAVAENGGRIRPPVTIVKALASALCIGGGGSVGREGPIVQIGSALASTLGQLVRMSQGRLRVIVACGARAGSRPRSTRRSPGCSSGLRSCSRSSRWTRWPPRFSRPSPPMSSAAHSLAAPRSSPASPTT